MNEKIKIWELTICIISIFLLSAIVLKFLNEF